MKRALKILIPILLVIVILASLIWYLFVYDRGFALDLLLRQARYWEDKGKHSTAAWFYDLAYKQSGNNEDVAIELAERFKAVGNYTKAEYTLSNAIRDGGTVDLYIALCRTYVEQDKLLDAVMMLDNVSDPQIKAQLDTMRPAAPTTDVEPGFYSQYLDVNIRAESGTLYLTTDGEYPSVAEAPHTGAITLPGGETTIYAVAVADNGLVSPVSIFGYTVGGVIEEVTFADGAIEQAIREALNVGQETVLYTDNLWTIRAFTVPQEAESFEDLSKLIYLTDLTMADCGLDGAGFLTGLQYLERLSITGSTISGEDLTAIATLPNLQELTLSDCGLSNIGALASAQQLRYLDLSENAIRDIDVLASLISLEELHLQHNALTGLTALSALGNLEILDVSYNALTSITPISTCVSLTWLDARENKLTNLGAVDNLGSLTDLAVGHNSLTDVSVLSGCAALESLDISNNAVTDITGLSALVKLREFDFSHNQVAVLPEWPADCALSDINGAYNLLVSLDALGGLESLNKVTMDYNEEVETVDALAECPVLVQVSVFGTKVADVSALTDLSVIVHYDPTQAQSGDEE